MTTVTWNIDADGLWSTAADWSTGLISGTLPGPDDDVFIDTAQAHTVTVDRSAGIVTIDSLTLAQTDTLFVVGGTLHVSGTAALPTGIHVTGKTDYGYLQISGKAVISSGITISYGTVDLCAAEVDLTGYLDITGRGKILLGTSDIGVSGFATDGLTTLTGAGVVTVNAYAYFHNGYEFGPGTDVLRNGGTIYFAYLADGRTIDNRGQLRIGSINNGGSLTFDGSKTDVQCALVNGIGATIELFGYSEIYDVVFLTNGLDQYSTLTNRGVIEGIAGGDYEGGIIGVTLVNNLGTIVGPPESAKGSMVFQPAIAGIGPAPSSVENSGLMSGNFSFSVPVTNEASGHISGTVQFLPGLTNFGTLTAGSITLAGILSGLINGSGSVTVSDESVFNSLTLGGTIFLNNTSTIDQTGQVTVGSVTLENEEGASWKLDGNVGIGTGSPHFINNGNIEKVSGSGLSTVDAQITNNGAVWDQVGKLRIEHSVNGTGGLLISSGAVLELACPTVTSGQTVDFMGGSAEVGIGGGDNFQGAIENLTAQDLIDVSGVAFSAKTLKESYTSGASNTQGTLSLSDGVHLVKLHMLGAYKLADFTPSADHYGGTLITFVPH